MGKFWVLGVMCSNDAGMGGGDSSLFYLFPIAFGGPSGARIVK